MRLLCEQEIGPCGVDRGCNLIEFLHRGEPGGRELGRPGKLLLSVSQVCARDVDGPRECVDLLLAGAGIDTITRRVRLAKLRLRQRQRCFKLGVGQLD